MTDPQSPDEGDSNTWQLVISADAEVVKAETIAAQKDED